MKRLGTLIIGLVVFSLPLAAEAFFHERKALVEATTLVGSPVRSSEGKDIGTIKQLLINPRGGDVAYAVVGVGGILGFGEKLLAIPWDDVKVGRDPEDIEKVVLTVDKEVLEKASRAEKSKDNDIKDREGQSQETTRQ